MFIDRKKQPEAFSFCVEGGDKGSVKVGTYLFQLYLIDLFTVVYFVTWPLNESEAGVDLVMIQTSLLFVC